MKILIASPLYPPDIAPLAVYVKELAIRLTPDFEVTVVAYSHIPEVIPNVRIIPVPKDIPLPLRLLKFIFVLWKEARRTDVLYIQNGASVELPARIVCTLVNARSVFRVGDPVALAIAMIESFPRKIFHSMLSKANHIIRDSRLSFGDTHREKITVSITPELRPEMLPFSPYPTEALTQYEKSWSAHLVDLTTIFNHGKK